MIIFAHGLDGTPHGTKARAIGGLGLPFLAPDFRDLPLAARVDLLERVTVGGGILLCGSSYGGLTAALVARRHPERFTGLLLFAPALALAEPPNDDPTALVAPRGLPTVILHGTRDTVVPLEGSRKYAMRSGPHVDLVTLDDDHRLSGSMDRLLAEVRRAWGRAAVGA